MILEELGSNPKRVEGPLGKSILATPPPQLRHVEERYEAATRNNKAQQAATRSNKKQQETTSGNRQQQAAAKMSQGNPEETT